MARPKSAKLQGPLHNLTSVLPGPEMIRVSNLYAPSKNGEVLTFLNQDVQTLYESFLFGVKESGNANCLGWREGPGEPYVWQSYNETLQRIKNFGSGLLSLGLVPGQNTNVGIFAKNCPEWPMTELACYCYSMVCVPLYSTFCTEACVFIVNQTEITAIVCEDDEKANLLLDQTQLNLKTLIMIKEASAASKQKATNRGVEIINFCDVEILGAKVSHQCVLPKPDDICTIAYTSGTTGMPKGVVLTHANVLAVISSTVLHLGEDKIKKNDVLLSILPLVHMYERFFEHYIYMAGGSIGFFSGDIQRLGDDLCALKPTALLMVPRLLNKIYDKTMIEVSKSVVKKWLFGRAMAAKEAELKRGIIRNDSIWDMLVLRKVRESMGGRVRIMILGSAPTAGNVLTFTRCAFGCQVLEGYGQTETSAPVACTLSGDTTTEHVGIPFACVQIKLVDVPEMNYFSKQNIGEVCIKGSSVFKGYYKEPAKTKEVIDGDGWLHSGDIGEWTKNGTLKIMDRKKQIFKLSQGEYIVPEKIENIYLSSRYVDQVFVHGESLKSCLVAVVVPFEPLVKSWASDNVISGTFASLCQNDLVKKEVMRDMLQRGRECGLKGFEQVKDIYLSSDQFTVQNDLLTPTMKSKRLVIRNHFKEQISKMYMNLE